MCALGGIECRLKQTTDRSDNRDVPLLVPSGVLSGVRPSCDILYHTPMLCWLYVCHNKRVLTCICSQSSC